MAANVIRGLQLIRNLPRVSLSNIKDLPNSKQKPKKLVKRGNTKGGNSGRNAKGQKKRGTLPRIGFEGGNTPFYLIIPQEPYYKGHHLRREYPPLSLLRLQRMIDLNRVNPDEPIDLTSICNTKLFYLDVNNKHFGINLTDEGADIFAARINIEVQWTNEVTIAAIERNGGTIITRYYDPQSLFALSDPLKFFKKGIPIPHCKLPTQDLVEYYTNPLNRGYLADPDKVREDRLKLAQKFGYNIPEAGGDVLEMLIKRKDPRQIFFDLEPGWVVNLRDKVILKPKDKLYQAYYKS